MKLPRFMFLALPSAPESAWGKRVQPITWVLASSNSRLLARANEPFDTYAACHDDIVRLRENLDRVNYVTVAIGDVARWTWKSMLDGRTIAISSRSYLRVRECHYSLGRFREAVGSAEVSSGIRIIDGGRDAPRVSRALAIHDSFGVH